MEDKIYFRIPDQLVIAVDKNKFSIKGPTRFTLSMKGYLGEGIEYDEKLFWLLEPELNKVELDLEPVD